MPTAGARHDQDLNPETFNLAPSALPIELFLYLSFLRCVKSALGSVLEKYRSLEIYTALTAKV